MVGEDHDPVRPGPVLGRVLDPREHRVEASQDPVRRRPVDAGVMSHLVVGEERRIHRRDAEVDVAHHRVDGQQLEVHVRPGAHEQIAEMRMDARPRIGRPGTQLAAGLQHDLPPDEQKDSRQVVRVVEEAEEGVSALTPAGGLARRQLPVAGVTGEEVSAARAVRVQKAVAARELLLERRDVLEARAADEALVLAVPPAERNHVLVVPEQDARLACAGLRGEIRLPAEQLVTSVREPSCEIGHPAGLECAAQDRLGEPVDLEEQHARHVGGERLALTARHALDDAPVVRVVGLVEDRTQQNLDEREDERHEDPVPEVHVDTAQELSGEQDHEAVQQEREETEAEEREGQRESESERPEHRVQEGDDDDHRDPVGGRVDREATERRREQAESARLDEPEDNGEEEPPNHRLRAFAATAARCIVLSG